MKPEIKKEKKLRTELNEYGLSLEMIRAERNEPRLFLCAVRGLLIFMASFGTLGGLVSAFDLDFGFARVSSVLFLISMFISLIYYNKVTFYTGYVLLLGGFAWFSSKYFLYVNSGYQAFLNVAAIAYDNYFHLPALRESAEIITNRYETVSMVMIFLGTVLAILLNIFISAYMSLPVTFLITFLPLQVAFYIDRTIPLPYLIMLLTVYICVMILKRSGNFALPSKYGKEHIFDKKEIRTGSIPKKISDALSRRKKDITIHKYLVSGSGMIGIAGAGLAIAAIFMLIMNGPLTKAADTDKITNSVKAVTDEYVKTVAQGGISALFDRYESKGGLSLGRLGGIGSVSPNFKTDLVVRFVPYGSETVYLRSYLGKSYGDNRFWPSFTPEESDTAVHYTLNSSGKEIIEEGWADDDYVPIIPGSPNEEPLKLESALVKPDLPNLQQAHLDIDINSLESLKDSVSSTYVVDIINEIVKKQQEFGVDDETAMNSLKYYWNTFFSANRYYSADFDGSEKMGWDRYAKLFIADVGADPAGEFTPYFSYYTSATVKDARKTFSDKWMKFKTGAKVIGNLASNGFATDYRYRDLHLTSDDNASPDGNAMDDFMSDGEYHKYSVEYIPYQSAAYYQPNPTITNEYEDYVYQNYLDIPEDIADALHEVAHEAGLDSIAEEERKIKDKYRDRYLNFYERIMSEDNGLSYADKQRAFAALRNYLNDATAITDFIARYGIEKDTVHFDILTALPLENLKTTQANLEENAKFDSGAASDAMAFEYVIGLVEQQPEKAPITGYEYAAKNIDRADYIEMQQLRLKLLQTLKTFYRNEFTYTMSPGRTPKSRDVVEYFLTKRRRGFCAHFASSACLLLRSVGIPARYVEGYVISPEAIAEGQVVDYDTQPWKYGDYGFEDSAVVDVEVSDASAHAWIEVYIDGYGWIPYEMTPPSSEDILQGGLFGLLSGMFTGRQNQQVPQNDSNVSGTENEPASDNAKSDGVLAGTGFILMPLLWLAAAGIVAWLIALTVRRLIYACRLTGLEKRGEYSKAILIRYRHLFEHMKRKGIVEAGYPSVRETCTQLITNLKNRVETSGSADNIAEETAAAGEKDILKLCETINYAAFSHNDVNEAYYRDVISLMDNVGRLIKKRRKKQHEVF